MPTYQYACTECEHGFEAVQKFTDDALTECPQCTGRLRKVFSAVGVVFKGSGFYRTDSRTGTKSGGDSNGSASSGSSSSDSPSSSSSSSDSSSTTSASGSSTKSESAA